MHKIQGPLQVWKNSSSSGVLFFYVLYEIMFYGYFFTAIPDEINWFIFIFHKIVFRYHDLKVIIVFKGH